MDVLYVYVLSSLYLAASDATSVITGDSPVSVSPGTRTRRNTQHVAASTVSIPNRLNGYPGSWNIVPQGVVTFTEMIEVIPSPA